MKPQFYEELVATGQMYLIHFCINDFRLGYPRLSICSGLVIVTIFEGSQFSLSYMDLFKLYLAAYGGVTIVRLICISLKNTIGN